MSRFSAIFLLAAVLASPTVSSAKEQTIDGSAAAIRAVVSGKICIGEDVLVFGKSVPGSAGAFERKGYKSGRYSVGYGTIMIRRDQDLHGHVTSVSAPSRMLYMSTSTYRCSE